MADADDDAMRSKENKAKNERKEVYGYLVALVAVVASMKVNFPIENPHTDAIFDRAFAWIAESPADVLLLSLAILAGAAGLCFHFERMDAVVMCGVSLLVMMKWIEVQVFLGRAVSDSRVVDVTPEWGTAAVGKLVPLLLLLPTHIGPRLWVSAATTAFFGPVSLAGIVSELPMIVFPSMPEKMAWMVMIVVFAGLFYSSHWLGYFVAVVLVLSSLVFGILGMSQHRTPTKVEENLINKNNVKARKTIVEKTIVEKTEDSSENESKTRGQQSKQAVPGGLWRFMFSLKSKYYTSEYLKMDKPSVWGSSPHKERKEKEVWIYVNGMANTFKDARNNCYMMYEMFGMPVNLLHNPTNGWFLDGLECIMGKTGILKFGNIVPTETLKRELAKELRRGDVEKVVLIAHSQGTIITGNTIASLGRDHDNDPVDQELIDLMGKKLEVYLFAGCAHHVPKDTVNHLEYLSNRGDFVAWLGHLYPKPFKPLWKNTWFNGLYYCPEGKDIVEHSSWGHELQNHYLEPMKRGKYYSEPKKKEKFCESKLVTYHEEWKDLQE